MTNPNIATQKESVRNRFAIGHKFVDKVAVCTDCKEDYIQKATNSRRCPSCTIKNHKLRKSKDAISLRIRLKEKGKKIAKKTIKSSIVRTMEIEKPNFNAVLSFKIPFNTSLSKNKVTSFGNGHHYRNPMTKANQEAIMWQIKASRINWIETKTYISLFVEKPNNTTDAINFIDTIADAIKIAIAVDDRWFCIENVDWQINRNDPKIWITIKQDTTTPVFICSFCGRILPIIKLRAKAKKVCFQCYK